MLGIGRKLSDSPPRQKPPSSGNGSDAIPGEFTTVDDPGDGVPEALLETVLNPEPLNIENFGSGTNPLNYAQQIWPEA